MEFVDLDAGTYYVVVIPLRSGAMDPVQYSIELQTDAAPLPAAELSVVDTQGSAGDTIFVPIALANVGPDEISQMSIGVQFDPVILEPLGVVNAGLTLEQWGSQVRYARSSNTISVSMDNFSTFESGHLLQLAFNVRPEAPVGGASALNVLAATLNGAIVPATDGTVDVTGGGLD